MKINKNFYTPILPLSRGKNLDYEYHGTVVDVVKQNLKNILLTNPGERVMDPDFGVGVSRFLFEVKGTFEDILRDRVYRQISKYAPYVQLEDVEITGEEDNSVFVLLKYSIDGLNLTDTLSTTVTTDVTTGGPKFVV
tara:strand:- start:136 stop:546 length:411 start_codon:yes stop_codon:yes gene_type:complete